MIPNMFVPLYDNKLCRLFVLEPNLSYLSARFKAIDNHSGKLSCEMIINVVPLLIYACFP